jgi:hypothetical protein
MGRGDHDELPPIEVLDTAREIGSVQEVSIRGPTRARGLLRVGLIVGAVVLGPLVAGLLFGDDDGPPAVSGRDEETTTTLSRSSTAPRPTSTTTTTLVAGPLFPGHGVRGWLLSGGSGGWTLVDIEAGAERPSGLPFDDPYSTWALPGGVVMVSNGHATFYDLRVPVDVREPVSLGPADQTLGIVGGDKVWLIDHPSPESPVVRSRARLVDLDGRELLGFPVQSGLFSSMTGPGFPGMRGAATPDGVLFGRGGRVYLATGSGARAVATGDLVGAVGSSVLIFTCGVDVSRCGIDLRTTSGALIRRLALGDWWPDGGWRTSSAIDGRFALVTYGPPGNSRVTVFEPNGETVATIEVAGHMPEAVEWLPNDAGFVASRNNRLVWIHQTGDGWVVEDLPGLDHLDSGGVLHVNRP